MKSKIIVFAVCLLGTSSMYSQNSIDLFTIAGQYSAPQSYKEKAPGLASERILNVNLKLPIVLNEKLIWYNEYSYFNFHVSNSMNIGDAVLNSMELHANILQTGIMYKFSEKKALIALFVPRLMGDLKRIGNQSFQFGGMLMYEKKVRQGLTLRYGVSLNQELFGPQLIPLLYVDWRIKKRWSIKGLIPIYLKIGYDVNERFRLGFHQVGLITSYDITDTKFSNDYVQRESIDLSLFSNIRLFDKVHFEARFGYSLSRKYTQYEKGSKVDFALPLVRFGDDRTQKNENFKDGAFINFRLMYRLPIED